MRTLTWAPGTNPEYDQLFEILRAEHYADTSHRLWKNYAKEAFKDVAALTIYFDDNGIPEMCSSILARDCWPNGAYRILNRLWKHSNKIVYPRVMSKSFGLSAESQINWLKQHTDYELYFISRETSNWEQWVIRNFNDVYNISFQTDNYKYLTCPNEYDDSCWQKIIYIGNTALLEQWQRK